MNDQASPILEYAPNMQADIDCLKKLFPAHVERINQISPYNALVLTNMSINYAHGKPKVFCMIETSSIGQIDLSFNQHTIILIVTVSHAYEPDDRAKDYISKIVADFPPWLDNIDSLRITKLGANFETRIRIELLIGVLPVFYESLVETKLFKYIKVLYFKLLEEVDK